jgi:hypothetical protein
MTIKRKRSQAVSRTGVNLVKAIVERQNSTFQEIDLGNDLGNDAYIEFVVEESATGCCVAAQIKAGASYKSAAGELRFYSDQSHFEYWSSHTLPILGFIVTEDERAYWVDITAYLRANPSVITEGPYVVPIAQTNHLSDATFEAFRQHCLQYRDVYSRETNMGKALESFSARHNTELCFDGLRALFAYHRQQIAAWYYMISCLSNYRGHAVLPFLIARLCHIPGHGDIAWSNRNIINEDIRRQARAFMRERLDRRDAITMLEAIDDRGIDRGTIGQCVHAIIEVMDSSAATMESIALDRSVQDQARYSAALLALYEAQMESKQAAKEVLARLGPSLTDTPYDTVLIEIERTINEFGSVSFY